MTQIRWVLLEIELEDGEVEQAKGVDGSVDEYIRNEIDWLNDSFSSVKIIEITDENDHSFLEEIE